MKNKILTRKHYQKIKKRHETNKTNKSNKTNKTNKKHNQKKNIQSMIGGKPKINFPYTYFILNFSDFSSHKTILNPYLNGQTKACDMISVGQAPDFIDDANNSFLKDINDTCILVLKYPDAYDLNLNLNLLDDINFLNKILGHAKFTYYKQKELIGIFNVCLHQYIFLNQSGSYVKQQKINKPGYGTVLFNCILTSVSFLKFNVKLVWLGIDVNNVNFEKITWMYISRGFNTPILSNRTPDGIQISINFIQLTYNPLTDNVNDEDSIKLEYYKTIDLRRQFIGTGGKEGIFSFTFNFDKSAILNLRLLPFLSFTVSTTTNLPVVSGIENFDKQRETAGRFLTYGAVEDNAKKIVYKLSLVLNSNSQLEYTVGNTNSVSNIIEPKVFHTHPFINYVKENVAIAPPSGKDFEAFYYNVVTSKSDKLVPQFFAVISIEGIYICSLNIDGLRRIKNTIAPPNIYNNISNNYEYPYAERYYNWTDYKTDPTPIETTFIYTNLKKYFDWFKVVNNQNGNIFNINFKMWNEFDRNSIFEIYYYYNEKQIE
jgi:hypothetical protein